jgi:hypothetical protein
MPSASSTNGSVCVVGANGVPDSYGIYTWTGRGWAAVPGGAVGVAVATDGSPAIINSTHQIYSA